MTPDENLADPALLQSQVPATQGLTTAVVKGSIWNFVGQVLALAISFVSIPFVIRLLGSEGYGVLVLVMLVPTYFAFADVGMGVASTKFESEAYARGDPRAEANVVRAAALIALLAASVIALAIFCFSPWILSALNVPEQWLPAGIYALRVTAVTFVVGVLASVLNSPMLARLRMDLNSITAALPKCLYAVGAPLVLFWGAGLEGVATWLLVTTVVGLVVVVIISGRLLPEMFRGKIDRSLFAPLLRFGSGWLFAVMAVMLLVNLEKLLLARMVSVQTLAYYSVAFTVANTALFLPQAMSQSLLPAFSRLRESARQSEFQLLFSRSVRLNLFLQLPGLMVMAVAARPLFRFWAGPEFEANSTLPFYILLAGLFFNILASVPHSVILSAGRTDLLARLYWLQLLIYPAAAGVLIYFWGISGAAAAWSLRAIADSILINVICYRVSGVRSGFGRLTLRLALPSLLLLPGIAVAVLYDNYSPWLLAIVPLSLVGYSCLVWVTSIEDVEKTWLRGRLFRTPQIAN